MNRTRAFNNLLAQTPASKLVFTEHFRARKRSRGISEAMVEDFLYNRQKDLVYAEETTTERGLARYKLFYDASKRKTILIVLDVESGFLRIVTCLLMDKRLQQEAVRNAARYARLAGRLRRS